MYNASPRPYFNEAEVRAKWLYWAEQNVAGDAAAKQVATEAAVQTLAMGGTVDDAVRNAFAAAPAATKGSNDKLPVILIIGGIITLFLAYRQIFIPGRGYFYTFWGSPAFKLISGVLLIAFGLIRRGTVDLGATRRYKRAGRPRFSPLRKLIYVAFLFLCFYITLVAGAGASRGATLAVAALYGISALFVVFRR